jgi:hypothetical protein
MNTLNERILNATGDSTVIAQVALDKAGSSNPKQGKMNMKRMFNPALAYSKITKKIAEKKSVTGETIGEYIASGVDGSQTAEAPKEDAKTTAKKFVIPQGVKWLTIGAVVGAIGIFVYKKFVK